MSSPSPVPRRIEVSDGCASSVIVHQVPPANVEQFRQWQHGITRAAEGFPGYRATDFYPAADPGQDQWVVVIHFANHEGLQRWLDSPTRAEWTAKLPKESADFRLMTLPGGFGPWFAGLVGAGGLPPHWKMALSVLLGLYPTVMVLAIFVMPHLSPLGLALSMLIGNALSIAILEWAVMPVLNTPLGPWLRARGAQGRVLSAGGAVVIVLVLVGLALLFRQVTG